MTGFRATLVVDGGASGRPSKNQGFRLWKHFCDSSIVLALCLLVGCSDAAKPVAAPVTNQSPASVESPQPTASASPQETSKTVTDDTPLPTISLGDSTVGTASTNGPQSLTSDSSQRSDIVAALQPIQILLGRWRGTTRKEVGDFKGLDEPVWVWDHRTDREHPALVMSSDAGVYFRKARLSWLPEQHRFRLITTDADGHERTFEGDYTEPPEEFQEAGSKVQKKFKLLLKEIDGDEKDRWQVVINQQNSDRYLVELSRTRPSGALRFDTIGHQRQGTSFALSDSDYGERKCIISGGLGTIQVQYQGRSYWVCCTGCEAAFNDDPEGWLREASKIRKVTAP